MEFHRATLTLGDDLTVEVAGEHQLGALLAGLCTLADGQVALLKRGQSDFIEATRYGGALVRDGETRSNVDGSVVHSGDGDRLQ